MALKPSGGKFIIAEQIIEDATMTGLTLWIRAEGNGFVLTILGNFETANRDFAFNERGENIGAGSSTCWIPSPNWLVPVEPT
jgi:hypothetical protein